MIAKSTLEDLAKNNIINVTFKKKDGSIRTLRGTLDWNFLKLNDKSFAKHKSKGGKMPAGNMKYCLIWDLDSSGFRLINPRTVMNLEIEKKLIRHDEAKNEE